MVEYKTIEKDGGETNEHKIRGNEWMSERASEIETREHHCTITP